MIRLILPVTICTAGALNAQTAICENLPYSQNNCVRVLACIGGQGLYFDGQARGWDEGVASGAISIGVQCTGTWTADGQFEAGIAHIQCDNGNDIAVIYHTQNNETGTVIGSGSDSLGQPMQNWSGENVLEFLTPDGSVGPKLPCKSGSIPMN